MSGNPLPTQDGECLEYHWPGALGRKGSKFYSRNKRVIFINGIDNSPKDHQESAELLSQTQMCPVIGVYNASTDSEFKLLKILGDGLESLCDKLQFNAPIPLEPTAMVGLYLDLSAKNGDMRSRKQIMRAMLSRNKACASLFDLLLDPANAGAEVFAHSQGNLITSNALQGAMHVGGSSAIAGRVIHSFGSPCGLWPPGIIRYNYAFQFDLITLLSLTYQPGTNTALMPPGTSLLWPFAHSFISYMKTDPEFFVNRHRWAPTGLTLSLDEEALAADLIALGRNMPRVYEVFAWLAANLPLDCDDVAVEYVSVLRGHHPSSGVIQAFKSHATLRSLLKKCMATGWVGHDEREAIKWLESL